MGAETDIAKALLKRFETFTHALSPLKAYPGKRFTPPAQPADGSAVYWLEARLFPAEARRADYASQEANRRGYLQIMVCVHIGHGVTIARELADAVAAHFPRGLPLEAGTRRGKVSAVPSIAGDFEEEGKVKIPVIIRYQAIA